MLTCRCVWSSGYTWMPPNPATTQPSNTSRVASVPRIVHHLSLEMQREAGEQHQLHPTPSCSPAAVAQGTRLSLTLISAPSL